MRTCPPDTPATTPWHRAADRYRAVTGPVFRLPAGVAVAVAVALAGAALPARGAAALSAAFFLAIGLYCGLNFWRCREPHCLVTGPGWTATGLVAAFAAAAGRDWGDGLWLAFLAVWVAGYSLELLVRVTKGAQEPTD